MRWSPIVVIAGLISATAAEQEAACEMHRAVRAVRTLGHGPMDTPNPFLFCVYHKDQYPAGNDKMEVPGRRGNGQHFDPEAEYRFYHGEKIPGFPQHPHRGFETITATIDGIIDHADSKGNAGRYGKGDVQWMHAGEGVVHGEMFPLIHTDKPNPTRFFQIWLNLPADKKMTEPDFEMHWDNEVAKWKNADATAAVTVWFGSFQDTATSCPAPRDSWAADPANDVRILHITVQEGAEIELDPASEATANRYLYFVEGSAAEVGGKAVKRGDPVTLIELDATQAVSVRSTKGTSEFLMLQGKPIDEPVVQHGPFVMNSRQEIMQAFEDYQRTQFGGWPWKQSSMVFPRDKGRFALLNGKETAPPDSKIL